MRFVLPMMEDSNSIQLALMEVAQMIALDSISDKACGKLLYTLQLMIMNKKGVNFEPERVTDVVVDHRRPDLHRRPAVDRRGVRPEPGMTPG